MAMKLLQAQIHWHLVTTYSTLIVTTMVFQTLSKVLVTMMVTALPTLSIWTATTMAFQIS